MFYIPNKKEIDIVSISKAFNNCYLDHLRGARGRYFSILGQDHKMLILLSYFE